MKRALSKVLCITLVFTSTFISDINKQVASATVLENKMTPAFPGAEGYGAYTTGGRGGEVYHVTTLNPYGPGSLHEAITTGTEPRTVVFDVSGYIDIPDGKAWSTSRSNLTIAGQTAPGDGVCLRGGTIYFKNADNINIRFMRFRRGKLTGANDCLYVENCENVIVDHCSFTWGSDEVLSADNNKNMTVQWSIVSEGLLAHSMGGLVQGNTISMHHNLYAHNNDRNPKVKGYMDFVNNVLYNWGEFSFVAGDSAGLTYANVEGNYFIAGDNSVFPKYGIMRGNENFNLYLNNNRIDSNRNLVLDGTDTKMEMIQKDRPCTMLKNRVPFPIMNIEEPDAAYKHVLDKSGASLVRDEIDQRIVNSVKNQDGIQITDEKLVGGFCELKGGQLPLDTDQDGIPDQWEIKNGLNPKDGEDRNKLNSDGYTSLELYLNELAAGAFPKDISMTIPKQVTPAPKLPSTEAAETPVFPTEAKKVSGKIVKNLVVKDTSNVEDWSVNENIQIGDKLFGDRNFTITSLPNKYIGSEWISVANDSKSFGSATASVAEFVAGADCDVYIAFDDRATKPAWVKQSDSGWVDTGDDLKDSQAASAGTYSIFKKSYKAGETVSLGYSNASKYCMYTILVVPNNATVQVPKAPADIVVKNQDNKAVTLNWSKVGNAVGYVINRSSVFEKGLTKTFYTTDTNYVDTSVTKGTEYYYKISAINGGGESEKSEGKAITIIDENGNIPGSPTKIDASIVESDRIGLVWQKVDDAIGYYIYRKGPKEEDYQRVGASNTWCYMDENLAAHSKYRYKVTAVGTKGESIESKEKEVTTEKTLKYPKIPKALKALEVTHSTVKLKWSSVTTAEVYNIYRTEANADASSTYVKVGSSNTTSFTDDSVSIGSKYHYKVTAQNDLGESEKSLELLVETPLPPAPIGINSGSISGSLVALSWQPVDEINRFNVYRADRIDGSYVKLGYTKVTSYYDRTVCPNKTFYYKVASIKIVNGVEIEGALSDAFIVKIPAMPLAPVQVKITAVTRSAVTLSWTPVTDAVKYYIYRKTGENGEYTRIGRSATVEFVDTTVSVDSNYYYKVSAVNEVGESEASVEVSTRENR